MLPMQPRKEERRVDDTPFETLLRRLWRERWMALLFYAFLLLLSCGAWLWPRGT